MLNVCVLIWIITAGLLVAAACLTLCIVFASHHEAARANGAYDTMVLAILTAGTVVGVGAAIWSAWLAPP